MPETRDASSSRASQSASSREPAGSHLLPMAEDEDEGRTVMPPAAPLGVCSTGAVFDVDMEEARQRLHDVQVALVALGCYGALDEPASVIDGVWGPRTRAAVAEFQQDVGLEVSGQIDADTYDAILARYDEGLSIYSANESLDDFVPLHAEAPLQSDTAGGRNPTEPATDEPLDNSTQVTLALRDTMQTPADEGGLEDLEP